MLKNSNSSVREKGKLIFLKILPRLHSESGIYFATQLLTLHYQDVQEFAYDVFRNEIPIKIFTPKSLVTIYGIKKLECIQLSLDLLSLYFEFLNTTLIHNKPVYNQTILNFIQILLNDYETQFGATLIILLQDSLPKWKECVNKELLLQILQAKSPTVPELTVFILNSDLEHFAQELTNSEIITITNHRILSVREVGRLFILQNLDKFSDNRMSNTIELLKSYYQDTQEFAYDVFKTKFAISLFTPRILVNIAEIQQLPAIQLSIDLLNQYFEYLNSIVIQNQAVYIQIILDFIQILLVDNDSYFGTVLITLLQENLPKWKECVNKELLLQILQVKSPTVPELAVFIFNSDVEHFAQEFTSNEIITIANHDILSVREVGRLFILQNLEKFSDNGMSDTVELLKSHYQDIQEFACDVFKSKFAVSLFTSRILANIAELEQPRAIQVSLDLLNQYFDYLNSTIIQNQSVYIQIILDFIQILLVEELNAQFSINLITLLEENLQKWKECVNKKLLLQILRAKSAILPELAIFILNLDLEHFAQEFTNSEIITMTNHDILAVREVGRRLVMLSLDNIRNNIEEILNTVQLLESKWEDTQNFGFTIFTTELTMQELTPSVLIRICDSTNKVARKFGRDLLTNCDGGIAKHEYILKFSEHPSQDMQNFVTHYLDDAAGNLEHLRALVPYFNTVLSNINCNSGAKKRVFKFLEQEALKNQEAAVIITEIIKRQSGVMAITDKAIIVQIMLKIRKAYPQLELPIKIQDVIEKRGRG